MLNVLRDNLKHLKWVLWLVCIGLVAYLGYFFRSGDSSGGGARADWAAKVDGDTILAAEFFERARVAEDYYRRLMGDRFEEIKPQLRLGSQVIQSLVDERIKLHEARKIGLRVSPEEVARHIQSDPNLKDSNGQFIGKDRYTALVQSNYRGGVADYERNIGEMLTAQKWMNLVTEAVGVDDGELEEAYRERNQKTKIDYAVIPSASQKTGTEVKDAELAASYESHKQDYMRGEARRIRYVVVDRQAQAAKVQVTDEDIQSYYDSHQTELSRPEQRRARHILFRVAPDASPADREAARKKAEDARDRIQKGDDFAALARSLSQDESSARQDGDLGFFGRGAMVGPFEQAAFATPVGQLAPVTETQFGIHVIQVTDSRAAGLTPLAEVKDQIRRQIEQQRAQDKVLSEAQRIRGMIHSAQELEAAAAREGLKAEERIVARDERLPELGPSPQFTDAVFTLSPGGVSDPVGVARGMALVAVLETVPPGLRPFEEVKERVRTDLLNARAREAARAAAAAAFAKHADLAEAARSLGVEVRKDVEVAPGKPLPGTGAASGPKLDRALFGPDAAKGRTGVVPVPAGAVIYAVTEVSRFDPATFASQKEAFREELLNKKKADFVQTILDRLRQKHQVQVNDELAALASQ